MGMISVMRRELRYIFSNKRLLLILFVVPLLYTTMFGYLYSANLVNGIKTVIVDQDKTPLSRTVVEAFNKSVKFDLVATLQSEEDVEKYIKEGRAEAALIVPSDFTTNIYKGESCPLLIIVNGSNMIISNSVTTSSLQIIQTLSTGIAAKKIQTAGGMDFDSAVSVVNPLSFRIRTWYNPAYNYSYFLILGLLATIIQQITLLYVAVCMTREKEHGTLDELRQIKGSAFAKVLGKIFPYVLSSLITFTVSLLIIRFVFSIPIRGSVAAIFFVVIAFLFCIVSLGVLLSLICKNEVEAIQYAMLVAVPSFLFSGFTWPLQAMPKLCKLLAAVLPLTYFSNALRDVAIMGLDLSGVSSHLTALVVLSLIFFPLAVIAYKFKYERGADAKMINKKIEGDVS